MNFMKNKTVHILHIEDNAADAANILEILFDDENFNYQVQSAVLLSEGLKYLARDQVDIVLLDLSLPDSIGYNTFLAVKHVVPDLPVIIMTGLADENLAVQAVQEGAQDYLVKGKVDTELLIRSIRYAIEREKLMVKLREAIDQIKILKGLLPICAHCKNIRDDKGFWHQVEEYVARHTEVEFTHGICPDCARKFYPEYCSVKDRKR